MRVFLAYLSVVLIWSTTPLAIKWSGEGPGYLFGVTSRMLIGWVIVMLASLVGRQSLPINRRAVLSYFGVAGHIYASLLAVYWAAQFIPSGWIAVIFGLTPMLTALLSALAGHKSLTVAKSLAYVLGLSGLAIMFGSALEYSPAAKLGILAVFIAAFLQAVSTVAVKRFNAGLPALAQVAGGLSIATPAYLVTWALLDGGWPEVVPINAVYSILYLGVIATPLGFAFYFYVLKHLAAAQVVLITLITPVMALMIGRTVNHEPVTSDVVVGTAVILLALTLHESHWIRRASTARETAL